MPHFGRTWWGERFIGALEQFTDAGRLGRGRSYAGNGRILSWQIEHGTVTAKVRGSINPYFGVYKEPLYTTTLRLTPIPRAMWTAIIADLASKAGFITKLLLNEVPDRIEEVFAPRSLALLPQNQRDFATSCSCPDYYNPCKHIAGLCYRLAASLDQDPFLLFELRGLPRDQLRSELETSPLGQILATAFEAPDLPLEPAPAYYTTPVRKPIEGAISYRDFWAGRRRLPPASDLGSPASVPALLIKKQGDYPPFWPKEQSFIGVMEEIYERVRAKSSQMK